ncbi:MAG TPA: transglutaminase family protein [Bryobacteraceae bacterium]|nr:transglutaminase family protein [Bryobacteraceae bacterium]
MKLRATHLTRYLYAEDVATCHTEVRLSPRVRAGQIPLSQRLEIAPQPDFSASRQDYFGNEVVSFSIHQPHRELSIVSECLAELDAGPPPNLDLSPSWEQVCREVARRASPGAFEAAQFVFESPLIRKSAAFARYAHACFEPGRRFLGAVQALSERIFHEFQYDPRATTVSTPVEEALAARRGVCQDFAHVMLACLRSLELPARYVSGYVRAQSDAPEAVAGASHAWVSVWCPVFGWRDFDPTNNVMPHGGHISLAWGRDYSDVPPVKGVALGGGEQTIRVSVKVSPLD